MASGKGGRPRLPESEKKKHKVAVLLTEKEWTEFESNYTQSGYKSQTEFILSRTASTQDMLSPSERVMITELRLGLSEVLEQYRKVGNNFNQLMHLAQAEKRVPATGELADVASSFENLENHTVKYFELIETLKKKWLSK